MVFKVGFPNSLMLGFHAEYQSGEIVCQAGEIAAAQWFTRDSLPDSTENSNFRLADRELSIPCLKILSEVM